jgi:hypothetical protein
MRTSCALRQVTCRCVPGFSDTEIAVVVYETIRGYNHVIGDPWLDPPWPGASFFHRDVTVSGVRAAAAGKSPSELHENWHQYYTAAGWAYGPAKDAAARPPTHPSLVLWGELSRVEQLKYVLFRDVVLSMSRFRLG